jgi:hypothetical protein
VFFQELVDEYFVDMRESLTSPLVLESRLKGEVGDIPKDVVDTVDAKALGRYFAEQTDNNCILRIPSAQNDALLLRPPNLRPALSLAMARLRNQLTSPNVLEIVAKLLDSSLLSVKQHVAGKDPSFWLRFTKTVRHHVRDITAHRDIRLDASFFHLVNLLYAVIQGQLEHAAAAKREREELEADCEAVARGIKDSPDGFVDQLQLNRILDSLKEKYDTKFENFREQFFERYVKTGARNSLPKITILDKRYIHRDNLFPMFAERFREISADLFHRFVTEMEHQLKTNNRNKSSVFYSLENFDDAIREAVSDMDWFLGAILKRPAVLAEAIIWHAKQNKLANDVSGIKQRLAVYFDPETLTPLPPHDWFNLHMFNIFESAFERLHTLRRIWIRITGKYDSFRSRYIGEDSIGSQVAPATAIESAKTVGTSDRSTAGQAGKNGRMQSGTDGTNGSRAHVGRGGAASGGTAARKRSKPTTKAKQRSYNKRQRDSAWEQFGESVKKKRK